MRNVNEWVPATGFDLYSLSIFLRVVEAGGFTAAASAIDLTQSAVSRQVQSLEEAIGVPLLERTTRQVRLTAAGEMLQRRAVRLLGDARSCFDEVQEGFLEAEPEIRFGVARSIGASYLPGFLAAYRRDHRDTRFVVKHDDGPALQDQLAAGVLDVIVGCHPGKNIPGLRIERAFDDAFVVVVPLDDPFTPGVNRLTDQAELRHLCQTGSWVSLPRSDVTGKALSAWEKEAGIQLASAMEIDEVDLIIALVSQGIGRALVPYRALPLHRHRRDFRVIEITPRPHRELALMTRSGHSLPHHIEAFLEAVLF